jgi:predicted alpha/beta superfamily hydrolase
MRKLTGRSTAPILGRMKALFLLAVACAEAREHPAPAAPRGQPLAAIGETFSIESRILGERRVINVYVPPGYAKSTERYPVLYMPDGGMAEDFPHVVGSVDVSIKNEVIRPVIVVGVENTERRRDLVGVTVVPDEQKVAPHAGGADRFRSFLRDELKPWVAAHYRTAGESALVGESLAGLFVVETFLVEPTLFDDYIAADPSVWWNEQAVVRSANAHLAWWTAGPKKLYVATADAIEMQEGVGILTTALRIYAPPVTWVYEPMPHEHHSTIFPTAALHGIRLVFAP